MKKGISMLLVMALLFCFGFLSKAEEPSVPVNEIIDGNESEIQPLYDYTNRYSETLSISNGTASCNATLTGISGTATKVVIKMTLQKKTLLWWSEVETWSATYNTYYGSLSKSAAVKSGTYRIKAVYTVYSGSNSESITDYSSQKTC